MGKVVIYQCYYFFSKESASLGIIVDIMSFFTGTKCNDM